MNLKKLDLRDKILFILGMSLCGVIVFVLVAGVIVSLFVSSNKSGKKKRATSKKKKVDLEQRLNQAIQSHDQGKAGDLEAIHKANHLLTRLRLEEPKNLVIKAYHGSTSILLAGNADNPIEKRKLAIRGNMLLNNAVTGSAEDNKNKLRLLRYQAASLLPVPSLYTADTAMEDYLHLLEWELCNPGSLDKNTYCRIIYELAEAYRQVNRIREAEFCDDQLIMKEREWLTS